MLRRFQLIRNIGRFDSHTGNDATDLRALALIYAENGRGKTTLSSILWSLRSGDAAPILARQRLGAERAPHVVVRLGEGNAIFENGSWSRAEPRLAIFDDSFVEQNVCSGLAVGPSHRQGLHQVVVGEEGVALAHEMEELNGQIEEAQRGIREVESQFDRALLGQLTVAEFVALPEVPEIEIAAGEARRRLTALENSEAVRSAPPFALFTLPSIPLDDVEVSLTATIDDIDAAALAAVSEHLTELGSGGETWLAAGMSLADRTPPDCPFCRQDLNSSTVFAHYRAYFGEAYRRHRSAIGGVQRMLSERFSGDRLAEYQRLLTEQRDRHRFWAKFVELPAFELDQKAIAERWAHVRAELERVFTAKAEDPLQGRALPEAVSEAIRRYEAMGATVRALSQSLQERNAAVEEAKAEVAGGDFAAGRQDLARLELTKARYREPGVGLVAAWRAAQSHKAELVLRKSELRTRLV